MQQQALQGVKVVELAWVVAGPTVSKFLADYGAQVIKVESEAKPDALRASHPFAGNQPGANRSLAFATYNSSKYSMALNLKLPEGVEVLKKLLQWADVFSENLTPGEVDKWGLGYEEVRKLKPDIIMVSMSLQGQTGPRARQPGYGNMFLSVMGFNRLTGWPEQTIVTPYSPYGDFIAPWYAATAILAALDYRRRKGKGQYIDVSQLEPGAQFVAPAILNYVANGEPMTGTGNRATYAAPHGVYRCAGDDRWCAIAIFSDEEWARFCVAIGRPRWTEGPRFATFLGRKRNEDDLDKLIEKWTIQHSSQEVMDLLQAVDIAAAPVQNNRDISEDTYLREAGFFQTLMHPEMGPITCARPPFTLSETPCLMRPAPLLGEHTEYVCREILKMSDEEIARLINIGVLL